VLPIFGYDSIEDGVIAVNATEFGLVSDVSFETARGPGRTCPMAWPGCRPIIVSGIACGATILAS
jgi:hypothetical protein